MRFGWPGDEALPSPLPLRTPHPRMHPFCPPRCLPIEPLLPGAPHGTSRRINVRRSQWGRRATSLLNVISHAAVVLGALEDTFVLSILVGVGFDVATRGGVDTRCVTTIAFLATLSIAYGCHVAIHVRALRMNASRERLEKVLRSALNNLRGIPGEAFADHVFAYTDLGTHLAPLLLSMQLLLQQEAIMTGCWILGLLVVASGGTLSRIPLNDDSEGGTLLRGEGNAIYCSCRACRAQAQLTGEKSSFTFSRRSGVCRLWLYSFAELLTRLETAQAKRSR
ncbi:hypothetical protein ACHAXT_013366 [Thalassiosira profunda]